ncbi:40S ribosomal protein S12 [Plecturocebus cupreus]
MEMNTVLQEVLKTALIHDGLTSSKPIFPCLHSAVICDEPVYVKLMVALSAEHQINLSKVDDNKKLGEETGLRGKML